jgi:hypothetical protein
MECYGVLRRVAVRYGALQRGAVEGAVENGRWIGRCGLVTFGWGPGETGFGPV